MLGTNGGNELTVVTGTFNGFQGVQAYSRKSLTFQLHNNRQSSQCSVRICDASKHSGLGFRVKGLGPTESLGFDPAWPYSPKS